MDHHYTLSCFKESATIATRSPNIIYTYVHGYTHTHTHILLSRGSRASKTEAATARISFCCCARATTSPAPHFSPRFIKKPSSRARYLSPRRAAIARVYQNARAVVYTSGRSCTFYTPLYCLSPHILWAKADARATLLLFFMLYYCVLTYCETNIADSPARVGSSRVLRSRGGERKRECRYNTRCCTVGV